MRARRLVMVLATFAAAAALPSNVPASARAAQNPSATPFGVRDLVRLERISDVAVSTDGKRAAYTLRTTDIDANKARTSIWLIETRKRNAQPLRLTDLAANSSSAEWSADGRFIYYLSNRSGTDQVWRSAPGGDPKQVTNLPLDVGSFHVAPKADRIVLSAEVYLDCPSLACTR